jgi:hypothetical protein
MDIHKVIETLKLKYKLTDDEIYTPWSAIYEYATVLEIQRQIAESEYI